LKNIWQNSVFIFCFLPVISQGQGFYFTTAFSVANNTGYGYNTYQKPGLYAGFGAWDHVELLKEGKIFYGLAFSQKGARKSPVPTNNDPVEYNLRLNYVEANLMFSLKMRSVKGIAGLNLGYLVSYSEKQVYGLTITASTSPFKKLDFSGTLGIGAELGKSFMLSLTGSYSILPIRTTPTITRPLVGPRNILFNIGLTFLLHKQAEPEETEGEE